MKKQFEILKKHKINKDRAAFNKVITALWPNLRKYIDLRLHIYEAKGWLPKNFYQPEDILADVYLNAFKLAQKWEGNGLVEQDKILLKLNNSIELITSYFAALIGNFIVIPLVENLTDDIIEHITNTTQPKYIYKEPLKFSFKIKKQIIPENIIIKKEDNEEFVIFFTSGTTSLPKPIYHSFFNIIGSAKDFSLLTEYTTTTVVYHILPLAYMAGFLNTLFAPIIGNAKIILGKKFVASNILTFWDDIFKYNINRLSITPSIAQMILKFTRDKDIISQVAKNVKQIQCTSSSIPQQLRKKFYEKFNVPLQDCYGITELGGPLTFQTYQDACEFNNFTKAHHNLSYKVIDSSLFIHSPYLMLNCKEKKEKKFFDTGDLALISQQNKIEIIGRSKDVIIRGGINISPSRIENLLSMYCKCSLAVIGLPHEYWGEIIVVCIEENTPFEKNIESNIIQISTQYLSEFEQVDKILKVDSFPRSFIGKLQKNKLKEKILKDSK